MNSQHPPNPPSTVSSQHPQNVYTHYVVIEMASIYTTVYKKLRLFVIVFYYAKKSWNAFPPFSLTLSLLLFFLLLVSHCFHFPLYFIF